MRTILILLILSQSFNLIAQSLNDPDPTIKVCVAGKCQSGDITKKDILRSAGVLLLDENKEKIGAISFEIIFSIKGQESTYENIGYMFTPECKEFIGQLNVGDSFQVRTITYKLPNGQVGYAEERNYRIID
jgi:hypothetical protein